jgi:hypothetical protein
MIHMTDKEEIDALKARIAQLEAQPKPPPTPVSSADLEREARAWMDKVHHAREAHMAHASAFSREDLAAMERATPTSMVQEIALRDNRAPLGPSGEGIIPSSQPLSAVRTGGSGRSGWAYEAPLGPSSHRRYVDAQLDAQDAKDRAELVERHVRAQAMQKLAESKP